MPTQSRASFALLPLLSILLIAACSPLAAVLEVGQEQLQLDSGSPTRELLLSNSGPGASLLAWHATVDSPLVHVSPSSGEVRGGRQQSVVVSFDFSGLDEGSFTSATISIESNGGVAKLPLRFLMGSSRACIDGGMQSQASGSSSGQGPLGSESASLGAFVPGELLVGYRPVQGRFGLASTAGEFLQAASVRAQHELTLLDTTGSGVDIVAADDPRAVASQLASDPRVEFAHPNYYVRPLALPDDPCLHEQWPLLEFGVPGAWATAGSAPVVLAVIDTGFDVDHEDLRGKTLPGYDLRDRDEDPRPGRPDDNAAHGTHVAGIALARGGNGAGIAGVAHGANVKLLPVKIFDDSGTVATIADLADAILWSAGLPVSGIPTNPHPAAVINISLGAGPERIAALDRAAERARRAGSLLLAAAGNNTSIDGSRGVQSPANAPAVLAVGSVDSNYLRSGFSDWGANGDTVDLMAPGGYGYSSCGRVRSTVPWSNYGCMAGTSMAAPFAAGVAALVLAGEPGLSPGALEQRLLASAHFDEATMNIAEYGYGVVCADRAVMANIASASLRCGSN